MKSLIARLALALGRYRVVGTPPSEPVSVMVAAPHTSNWDFPLMLFMAWKSGLSPRWLGKKEMFAGPLGPFFRALGGVSVDRKAPGKLVADLVQRARTEKSLVLVIPAEGTRKRSEYWKSGFYRIAAEAGIPIALSFVDNATRTGGFGPVFLPTGNVSADMDLIREFYADKGGVKPENKTPARLREEDDPAA